MSQIPRGRNFIENIQKINDTTLTGLACVFWESN